MNLNKPNHWSEECAKSELDLFTVPPVQTSVEDGVFDIIESSKTVNDNAVVTFEIPNSNDSYIDLSATEMHFDVQIVDALGNGYAPGKKIAPVNNFIHSLFRQVQIRLNNARFETTNNNYPYRAYYENLLLYNKESKETFLKPAGWIKDSVDFEATSLVSAKKSDAVKLEVVGATAATGATPHVQLKEAVPADIIANPGFITRNKLYENGKTVQLVDQLHCDICNINRYMVNNMGIIFEFTKANPEFYLMGDDAANYKVKFVRAFLRIRRCIISAQVMLAHVMALEKTTAKYPIKRIVVNDFAVDAGVSSFRLDKIVNGILPSRLVLGFVTNEASDGKFTANPFNFQNLAIRTINVVYANVSRPYSKSLELDFENDDYLEGYNSLFKNIRAAPCDITYEEYKTGNTIFAFDFTPDLCSADHYSLYKTGTLNVEVFLSKTVPKSMKAICYLEFDNILEIDKFRKVSADFTLA